MGKQDKDLLLKDLCARLPYGVKIDRVLYGAVTLTERLIESFRKGYDDILIPYLRPMSSMTEEEKIDYQAFFNYDGVEYPEEYIDWLNSHHFDYRGLIDKGLALEAPKDMYSKEIVGVKETPTKTFPRANEFETDASYRR